MNTLKRKLISMGLILFLPLATYASEDRISLFSLDHYDQTLSNWFKPNDADYEKELLTANSQQKRLAIYIDRYFGSTSPWNPEYVNQILHYASPNDLKTNEQNLLINFSNTGKSDSEIGYGENYRPYSQAWIDKISKNINLAQFDNLIYQDGNRGIAIDNLHARALPTDDVHFYSFKLAGEGFPFDNLQMSSLWAGTPVYIVGETRDRAWALVVTPDFIGWVKSLGIARTNSYFVNTWTLAAKNKLAAIIETATSLVDNKGKLLLQSYVGSVFPVDTAKGMKLMVPVKDTDGNAIIKNAVVSPSQAVIMPLAATPKHFALIMKTLINRPYGWGSIYLYNDCSAELKSLLTPFGIWIPRHSSDQVTQGKIVDMTFATTEKRLAYLMENGEKFLTLVYLGGHVVLYVGNYPNPYDHQSLMAMTYQNMWGLHPTPSTRRAVIGQSVLFPMLLKYPEDTTLASPASGKFFQLSYLSEVPNANAQLIQKFFDIKSLMFPSNFMTP
ncbi:MAG: SH3 domain-containing protein [Gammaproteobacteria bacterium]|nr:SH3 domain-containing protein [Gammaproteobacteria bacterium]